MLTTDVFRIAQLHAELQSQNLIQLGKLSRSPVPAQRLVLAQPRPAPELFSRSLVLEPGEDRLVPLRRILPVLVRKALLLLEGRLLGKRGRVPRSLPLLVKGSLPVPFKLSPFRLLKRSPPRSASQRPTLRKRARVPSRLLLFLANLGFCLPLARNSEAEEEYARALAILEESSSLQG